jgi:hypothetical protein
MRSDSAVAWLSKGFLLNLMPFRVWQGRRSMISVSSTDLARETFRMAKVVFYLAMYRFQFPIKARFHLTDGVSSVYHSSGAER